MRRSVDSFDDYQSLTIAQQQGYETLPQQLWPDQWHASADFPQPQTVGTDSFNQVLNDGLSFDSQPISYRLGDPSQAIAPYRDHIIQTVHDKQIAIIAAGLGSGKSTQIPLYKLEEYMRTGSDKKMYITSPRKLPTKELQEYVQTFVGPELKHLIGRLTGNAEESDCHPDARIIFGTERLLLKKLVSGEIRPHDDVMIDEPHEATKPMTVFAACLKEKLPETPNRHIFVSSGTLDNDRWAAFMAHPVTGEPAPIINIEGRNYPVAFEISDKSVADVAREHMEQGLNVVAFEPGSGRMNETASRMSFSHSKDSQLSQYVVHVLHGDQSPREQAEALNPQKGHHIVANKVGETSITPEGKDVVVSSGLSNIGGYEEGVHVLETVHASKSAIRQQGGRVGRTKEGKHILAVPTNAPPIAYEDRPDYDPPEIQSECIASEIAEVLTSGVRLEDLPLLYAPNERNLRHDYALLRNLGAIALVDGVDVVTDIGHQMLRLPIDMPQARSVVEARLIAETEQLSGDAVRLQACAIAAIQQVNGILEAWNNGKRREQLAYGLQNGLSEEKRSDPLFELDAFVTVYDLQRSMSDSEGQYDEVRFERLLRAKDIKLNPYYKALRTFRELCRREDLDPALLQKPTTEERAALLRCQIVGTEELFVKKGGNWYWDRRGQSRQLGIRSTVFPELADILVGSAFTLRGMTDRGKFERRYVAAASAVSAEQVIAYAGHRITRKSVGYGFTSDGQIHDRQALYFDGVVPFTVEPADPAPTLETRQFIIRTMMTGASIPSFSKSDKLVPYPVTTPNAKKAIRHWQDAQDIENRTQRLLDVDGGYERLINRIVRESVEKIPLDVTDPRILDTVITPVSARRLVRPSRRSRISDILETSPDFISINLDDETGLQVPVTYRNGIAYVTVPTTYRFQLKREDFAQLTAHHGVKLRTEGGQYKFFDAAFETLDEKRVAHERKKAERAKRLETDRENNGAQFEIKKWSLKKSGAKVGGVDVEKIRKDSKVSTVNKRQAKLTRKREVRSDRRRARQAGWIAMEYVE